jgi:hypothetical protein
VNGSNGRKITRRTTSVLWSTTQASTASSNRPDQRYSTPSVRFKRIARVLTDSFSHFKRQGRDPAEDPHARDYLPRVIVREGRNEGFSEQELARAMKVSGLFKEGIVGQYANRTPKKGLVLVEDAL